MASTCLRARVLRGRDQGVVLRGIGLRSLPTLDGPARRQVAVDQIVRGRLVGDHVGAHAAPDQLGKDLRRVADEPDRARLARFAGGANARERVVEVARLLVEVARRKPHRDARRLALDREHRRAGHRRGERLRAAHAAQAAVRTQRPLRFPP
jgi:hypothetical protein